MIAALGDPGAADPWAPGAEDGVVPRTAVAVGRSNVASGLRSTQLPFVHLDISGVVVTPPDWQAGKPTGSPIAALIAALEVAQRG